MYMTNIIIILVCYDFLLLSPDIELLYGCFMEVIRNQKLVIIVTFFKDNYIHKIIQVYCGKSCNVYVSCCRDVLVVRVCQCILPFQIFRSVTNNN